MISYAHRPSSAAEISASSGAMFPASLRTGTTMETATGESADKATLMVGVGGVGRASRHPAQRVGLLWGRRPAINPLEPARSRDDPAARPDCEPHLARGKPV